MAGAESRSWRYTEATFCLPRPLFLERGSKPRGAFCELHVQPDGERKPIVIGHLATGRAVVLPIQSLRGLEAEKHGSQ